MTSKVDELAIVHQEMRAMREHLIETIDNAFTGRETGEWVGIEVLKNMHEREQTINEEIFAELPSDPVVFTPSDSEESQEEIVEQLRIYKHSVDPKDEGFLFSDGDLRALPRV